MDAAEQLGGGSFAVAMRAAYEVRAQPKKLYLTYTV
ncbi:unnamed protein product [Ectocarpus sp. 12 AP-2014]